MPIVTIVIRVLLGFTAVACLMGGIFRSGDAHKQRNISDEVITKCDLKAAFGLQRKAYRYIAVACVAACMFAAISEIW